MTEPVPLGSRLARFASYNVGQQLWLAVLSLVAAPILYHRMGAEAYGILAVVNLVVAQLSILELGFGHATIRRLAQFRASWDVEELSRTVAAAWWVFLAAAVVGGVTVLVAADTLAEGYFRIPTEMVGTGRVALRIGAALVALTLLGNLAGAIWQGLQRFGYLNLVSGVAATAQLLGSIALVLLGFGVVAVLVWSVALGVSTLSVHAWWLARQAPGVRVLRSPGRRVLREMAGFGALLMLAGLLTQVFYSGGPLVLGHYVAVGALPFFTVPFGMYQRLNRMGYGVAGALYPLVSELYGVGDTPSLNRVFTSGTRILLVAGVCAMAPAVLVSSPFLSLWMGPDFADQGGAVFELLLIAFTVSLATIPSVELARGTGRARLLVAYTGLLASMNVAGVILLAPRMGPTGAGVAFVSAQCVASAFLFLRVGRGGWRKVFRPPLLALLGSAVAATTWGLGAIASPGSRLVAALAMGLVLTWAGVAFALDGAERTTLRRMIGRP